MGHAGREPDTFEWVVPRLPYIVIYEVDRVRELITITAVLHERRIGKASVPMKALNIGKSVGGR
jgi:hypothetical protein